MARWLVLGIGNTLRRDDGLGPWLAERIAGWSLPEVAVRTAHQLLPEMAAEMVNHDCVLLVDASCTADEPRLLEMPPGRSGGAWSHAPGPADVVALAAQLYGRNVPAWMLVVPGTDFDFGEGLSPEATAAGDAALAMVRGLLEGRPCTKSA